MYIKSPALSYRISVNMSVWEKHIESLTLALVFIWIFFVSVRVS